MRKTRHRKEMLQQRIESHRELMSLEISALKRGVRPYARLARAGREAGPALRSVGSIAVSALGSGRMRRNLLLNLLWIAPVAALAAHLLGNDAERAPAAARAETGEEPEETAD